MSCFQHTAQINEAKRKVTIKNSSARLYKQFAEVMARLSRKEQQDKRELLASLNHVNKCIGAKHAAENRKSLFSQFSYFIRKKNAK